jgi:HD superfamily phosphohydrolase
MSNKQSNSDVAALPLPAVEQPRPEKARRSTKADRQEFFLPVTGFAWFYPEEKEVINHPAFQRLGRINQLGQAYLVFRGATHKRIEHVLGAVHIAQKMISSVNFNAEKSRARGQTRYAAPLTEKEQRFIRLGALLHDIGHVAAGHTLEDELGLIGKHDADGRLDEVFNKDNWDSASARGQVILRDLINEQYQIWLPESLASAGLSAADVVRLLIRKRPDGTDDHDKFQKALEANTDIRYHVCSNMIGNTICADLLDYTYRDWYHVGKPRQADDRIFQYMEIRRKTNGSGTYLPSGEIAPHIDDRFVIALGQKTKIRTDGVSAILGLLEWRYELAETVLFHRTKVAAGAMLDRALFELWETADEKALVKKVLLLSDEELVDEAIEEARGKTPVSAPQKRTRGQEETGSINAPISILWKLRDRDLFKELATFDATNLVRDRIREAKKKYAAFG